MVLEQMNLQQFIFSTSLPFEFWCLRIPYHVIRGCCPRHGRSYMQASLWQSQSHSITWFENFPFLLT